MTLVCSGVFVAVNVAKKLSETAKREDPPVANPSDKTRRVDRVDHSERPKQPARSTEGMPEAGDDASVTTDVFAATSDDAHESLLKFLRAKDDVGIKQMILLGRVVVLSEGTIVRVLNPRFFSIEVRVRDGINAGRVAIIEREFLKKR